jgi:pyrroline-5-carboxylate reductase
MNHIIIIGAGNMGRALAKGFLRNPNNIIYFKTTQNTHNPVVEFTTEIQESRVLFSCENDFFSNIKNPWIVLAVKPQKICSVITQITDILDKTTPKALISVAAGINISSIKKAMTENNDNNFLPIIRTMPNISVATGQGVIGYISDTNVMNDDFLDLCRPLGMVYALREESEFHLFTALAGSGPAFFFHTIEAMAQAADSMGIDYKDAQKIATQVFIGTASVLHTQERTPKELRESVTSPNGTTQAGLEILINPDLMVGQSNLGALFKQTFLAAATRSENIEKNS